MVETRFDCPTDIKANFVKMCASRDETPGAMMRLLMKKELKRWNGQRAKRYEVPDEPLLAHLRLRVAGALEISTSWTEFISHLQSDHLILRPAGGGLALHSLGTGKRLAKASDVGPGYSELIRKFKAGFPGHPHVHLVPLNFT